jgi:UDP-N-acetylglucosamine 3-dehydrogenase
MEQVKNTNSLPSRLLSRDIAQFRVAVTGLGKMGSYHIQALQQLAKGESEEYYKSGLGAQICKLSLCGICDPNPEKFRGFAADIPSFTDWRQLLAAVKPDLAIIASPTQTHFALAQCALEAGVHILVEKPLVTSVAEFNTLNQLAAQNGCRLMSGHVERYNPVSIKLRAMLAANEIDAASYHFQRSQPHDARITDDIVTDKIVHDLDLAQYFFGDIANYSLLNSKQAGGRTQEATVMLHHANGTAGIIFVSWLLPETKLCREVRINCKDGTGIIGDFAEKTLKLNGEPLSCAIPSWIKPDNNQIKDELADFLAHCLIPDPDMPFFQPLLLTREIATSVAIIEDLIKLTSRGSL